MIGTNIGRYELLRPLAAGGMGELYLARHEASLPGFGSLVAIKVLLENLSSNKAFVQMFLDEARTVAKLRHDHIVQIRDIAQHGGQYYMVMEYIAGQNLRELLGDTTIEDRPLFPPHLGAQVFADLASALAVVHREGLVHRDLSPNNIMISDEGVPKLIDFGVARALGNTSLTNPGTLKGKFGYMAPEYIKGQAYDHRVDLFSLGVVMWETFARRRLFHGTNAAEQIHRVLDAEIPRLDAVLSGFPMALAEIVASALERDPARRIPTATALADALGELARAQPVNRDEPTLRAWLARRIAGQIEARRELASQVMALPAQILSRISSADAVDLETSSARLRGATPLPTNVHSGTSIRLASGELVPSARETRGPHGRKFVAPIVAASVLAIVALVAVPRWGAERTDSIDPGAAPQMKPLRPNISALPSLADAHRERGLKAMGDHDYAKAISEFAEAMRGGADSDLLQLMELARRLHRDLAKEHLDQVAPSGQSEAPHASTPMTVR